VGAFAAGSQATGYGREEKAADATDPRRIDRGGYAFFAARMSKTGRLT
jgi:hypothetical protein